MPVRVQPLMFGDVEIAAEVLTLAGAEPLSAVTKVGKQVTDALSQAQTVIVAMAGATADAIRMLREAKAKQPDKVEVEFGIGFSVKGNAVVVTADANATLKVKLVYDNASATG